MKYGKFAHSAKNSAVGMMAIAILAISAAAQDQTGGTVAVSGKPGSHAEARPTAGNYKPAAESPVTVYRIGLNDLLRIELNDIPGVPKVVRVQSDGTINFPLAGENVVAAGKTAADTAAMLSEAVKSVTSGGVQVKVVEYLSHTITILGLVESAGEQQIQRDAVPFYVVKAMANVAPRADRIRITRAESGKSEEFALGAASLDSLLVYPGDSVEFEDGRNTGN